MQSPLLRHIHASTPLPQFRVITPAEGAGFPGHISSAHASEIHMHIDRRLATVVARAGTMLLGSPGYATRYRTV